LHHLKRSVEGRPVARVVQIDHHCVGFQDHPAGFAARGLGGTRLASP